MMRHALLVALAAASAGCAVSLQEEVQMGADYSAQINAQLPIVQDAEVNRYVNVLGDSIAGLADPRGLDYRFFVVNAPEVNAFAVPGGFIYVNRGLIDRTTSLAQLAGVLGHEIGHVVRRHSVQQMQKAQGANFGIILGCVLTQICSNQAAGAAIEIGGAAVFAKFSRDDENEADEEAVKNVVRAGLHPKGIPEMFQILLNERNARPDAVAGWFTTHPGEDDRIRHTEALIAQYDEAILRTLPTTTPRFAEFQARVRALPPPPPQERRP